MAIFHRNPYHADKLEITKKNQHTHTDTIEIYHKYFHQAHRSIYTKPLTRIFNALRVSLQNHTIRLIIMTLYVQ